MNIFRIVKKELDKIFKFPRQILTTLVLPGLLIFLIYTFLGVGVDASMKEEADAITIIHVINSPESLDSVYESVGTLKIELKKSTVEELEDLKDLVIAKEIHAILLYDENFDDLIQTDILPNVKILYDSSATNAYLVMERAQIVVAMQRGIIYEELNIDPNIFNIIPEKVEPEEKGSAVMLAMILPMLLMSFIFASALSTGSDAIAGEKERGTLATLLLLPIKRSHIIIGKTISTSTITIISALSSFLGIMASWPFAKSIFAVDGDINFNYGAGEIIGLVVMLLLIALLASSILLIISTLAKNIKEATTLAMPIYIAAIIVPIITMFQSGEVSSKLVYFIPLYNTILGLKAIISLNFDLVNFLLILGSTLVYIALFIFILIKMFKSEKVLYSK